MNRGMKLIGLTVGALGVGLWTVGCDNDPLSPDVAPTAEASLVAPGIALTNAQRTALGGGVAHYTWEVALGPEPFDVVRLHRVVREQGPDDPVRTRGAIFMLPGSPNYWTQVFLQPAYSGAVSPDDAVAIYLAQNDIDVWGIDYAWAQVPAGTTDFTFMREWGFQKDIDFAYGALGVARSLRVASGQGNTPFHVLGFSYGVPIAYAIAGAETQMPPGQRLAKGLVIADFEFLLEDPDRRDAACSYAAATQTKMEAGKYHDAIGATLKFIGTLAAQDPDGHFFDPVLTNYQFGLFVGAVNPGSAWHFVAGEFDGSGIPTGLRFTDPALWVDLMQNGPLYIPLKADADLASMRCMGDVNTPFDGHLGDITLPILDVDAAGGAGRGNYTASRTATTEYRQLHIQLLSDAEAALDFGHADLFTASNAESLVWTPLLAWLLEHQENRVYP
ncbi:MAG: hypothetical protein RQ751_11410 [Longimicrobiales bacterium]|nr:hypothetical protein [Longimicrobiales bacterium]